MKTLNKKAQLFGWLKLNSFDALTNWIADPTQKPKGGVLVP